VILGIFKQIILSGNSNNGLVIIPINTVLLPINTAAFGTLVFFLMVDRLTFFSPGGRIFDIHTYIVNIIIRNYDAENNEKEVRQNRKGADCS
jgi:hypothetical protein